MTIWMLLLATASGANEPTNTPANAHIAAAGITDPLVNRVLSPEEAGAYRLELRTAAEMYSLDTYRESAKQTRQLTGRQAARSVRDAEGRAAASAQLRTELTWRNLHRFRPRKRIVLLNHYWTMKDIDRERQAEENAANAETMRARRDSQTIECQLNTLERVLKNLAQVPVHAKYGQAKTLLSAFGIGLAAMPSAWNALGMTENANLREEAAGDIEEAFRQALLTLENANPAATACILARQNATLRTALSSAAFRGLAVYVAEAWDTAKEHIQLSAQQSLIAEYWLTEAAKVASR